MQKINDQQYELMAPKILAELINYNNSTNWKQFLEGKTQGYTMSSQTDSVIAKGVTVLQLPFDKVYDFINKDDSFKKMNENCLQFKVLHNNPGKFKITYVQIKTPFPLDNRQTLCMQAPKLQKDIYYVAVKSCNYPKQVEPKFVRAKINIAGWILQRQGNRTKVTYISDIDPMGNVPDVLKNSMAGKRAQIVGNLENIMKKTDIDSTIKDIEIYLQNLNQTSKNLSMSDNIKIYKFLFKAHITKFDLKANISSPLIITWKRSNQTATSEPVQMVSGKAQIDQTLNLPVNMYFQLKQQKFQQKSKFRLILQSAFSFTMRSPKGDKQAGVVYVDLSQQINDKIMTLDKTYMLQKCPVKNSEVHIQITGQCIGEKDHDNMSQDSFMMQNNNPSSLSIQSHYVENKQSAIKQSSAIKSDNITSKQNKISAKTTSNKEDEQKDKKIRQLQSTISQIQKQNKKLSSQLTQERQLTKKTTFSGDTGQIINTLKQQILKGKSIQQKLQAQIQNYRQQNIQNQNQLQKIREKMDKIYDALCHQFGIQQL